ncbi:hypothetical protein A6770_36975 [Nostoc minutum NIES-26]|uniref:Uncharacterized protein n=1 Tax=Nostoc minutum NIES-26 TaxID=1844469 RepID=A0A367RYY4_9NOSO|nr:hypothetical protein A6770_36975 [Nostoc minutum NIES-26]
MNQESSFNSLPVGLHFYWYEAQQSEKHPHYWAQLCSSMHRLRFVCEELNTIYNASDINEALYRLEYHMENYLNRIYELRERAAQLLKAFSGSGDIGKFKGKATRKDEVERILPNNPEICSQYLDLLSLLDDDINLRNKNTHNTFLSLGYFNGFDIYNSHDLLIELQAHSIQYDKFVEELKEAIDQKILCYENKINKIIELTESLLKEMDFISV